MIHQYSPIPQVLGYYNSFPVAQAARKLSDELEDAETDTFKQLRPLPGENPSNGLDKLYYFYDIKAETSATDSKYLFLAAYQPWYPNVDIDPSLLNHSHLFKTLPSLTDQNVVPKLTDLEQQKSKDGFINYCQIPTIYGDHKIPPLVYCTSESIYNNVFIFWGLTTDNVTQPTQSYRIRPNANCPEYPFPLEKWIIDNPSMVPNKHVFIMNADTDIVKIANVFGDVPPPLCCCSATNVSNRYIFIYGGFEIINIRDNVESSTTPINDTDEGGKSMPSARSIRLNNRCWVLDVCTLKYRELNLVAHPTINALHPTTIARFGHSATTQGSLHKFVKTSDFTRHSAKNRKEVFDTSESTASTADIRTDTPDHNVTPFENEATNSPEIVDHDIFQALISEKSYISVFVFGGFKYNEESNLFTALNDFWKIDLIISDEGPRNYIYFSDEALASPVATATAGPSGRAFHSVIMCDDSKLGINKGSEIQQEAKLNTTNQVDANVSKSSKFFADKSLIVHGGNNENQVLSDFWRFSFNTGVWEPFITYAKIFDRQVLKATATFEVKHTRTNHAMVLLGQYVVFTGGLSQLDINKMRGKLHANNEESLVSNLCDMIENAQGVSEVLSVVINWGSHIDNAIYNDFVTELDEINDNDSFYSHRLPILDLKSKQWIFNRYDYETISSLDFDKQLNTGENIQKFHNLVRNSHPTKLESFVANVKNLLPPKSRSSTIEKLIKTATIIKKVNDTYNNDLNGTIGSSVVYANRRMFKIGGIQSYNLLGTTGGANNTEMDESADGDGSLQNGDRTSNGQESVEETQVIENQGYFVNVLDFELPVHSKDTLLTNELEQEYILGKPR